MIFYILYEFNVTYITYKYTIIAPHHASNMLNFNAKRKSIN